MTENTCLGMSIGQKIPFLSQTAAYVHVGKHSWGQTDNRLSSYEFSGTSAMSIRLERRDLI